MDHQRHRADLMSAVSHMAMLMSGGNGNDTFTKILLHMDGTDASTTFTDSKMGDPATHTWTAAGNAQIDTAISKFGGAAGLFDGTGDFVTTPDDTHFYAGSGNFTVDFWFNRAGGDGTSRFICGQADSSATIATRSIQMVLSATNTIQGSVIEGGAATTVTSTTTFTATGWHHVAFVRTGNVLKLFIDGTQEGGDVAFTGTVNNSTNAFGVGCIGELTSLTFFGSIDEFRLSVGVARWTANFTPPVAAYS
jgi:concanavalin A-like lectin/glucanase superfamily protein